MKIGIIGSDDRAVAIGRLFASSGHDVTFGDPRGDELATSAAAKAAAQAEKPYNQAMTRDVVVFALPRKDIDRALTAMGSSPKGVVLDALGEGPAKPHCGAELLAQKLDSHNVVRAMIVLPQPGANVPICGDDPAAKAVVTEAFVSAGCLTADRGTLENAPELEPVGQKTIAA
jgi:predicted dinucleotide-binding enzyme